MFDGIYLSKEEYKEVGTILKKSIPENVTGNHLESLKSRIDFGNEFSLKTRLLILFDKFEGIFQTLIEDRDEFVKEVRDTRNFLTHYSEELEQKAKEGRELLEIW